MQQTPSALSTSAECKAVLVDGASTVLIKQAIGVDLVNCSALYNVLVHRIGTSRKLAFPPMITIAPTPCSGGNSLAKQLAGAGFDVVMVESRNSADDKVINDRIARIDPRLVSEIVLMSSDRDYVPQLRAKASHGIKIHWASTLQSRPGTSHCGLSRDVTDLFDSGEFHFTELASFAPQICKQSLGSRATVACSDNASFSEISLKLNNRNRKEHFRLLSEVQHLVQQFKGLSFTIEK